MEFAIEILWANNSLLRLIYQEIETAVVQKNKKSGELEWEAGTDYFKNLRLPVGGNPVFVDIDNDGDLDLMIGSAEGTLHYYRNTGY